jgi:hypothetical protein
MNRSASAATSVALLVVAVVSACGSDSTYPACIGAVRYGDATYREVGFTSRQGEALTENAEFATCDTVTRNGARNALRDNASSIKARSLPGYRPDQAITVQVTDSAWSVLVPEDASKGLLRQIHRSGLLDAGQD